MYLIIIQPVPTELILLRHQNNSGLASDACLCLAIAISPDPSELHKVGRVMDRSFKTIPN